MKSQKTRTGEVLEVRKTNHDVSNGSPTHIYRIPCPTGNTDCHRWGTGWEWTIPVVLLRGKGIAL